MLAAEPAQTVSDATPIPAQPKYLESFYRPTSAFDLERAPQMSPANFAESSKGGPDKDSYTEEVREIHKALMNTLYPKKRGDEDAPIDSEKVIAGGLPDPVDVDKFFYDRIRAGYRPTDVAMYARDLFQPTPTKKYSQATDADMLVIKARDAYIANRGRVPYADILNSMRQQEEAVAPPTPQPTWTESVTSKGKKYLQDLMGGGESSAKEGKTTNSKKRRFRSVPDGKGGLKLVEVE